MAPRAESELREEVVPRLELAAGAGGVAGVLELDRSQLNGDRFGGVGAEDGDAEEEEPNPDERNGDDSFLVLPAGGVGLGVGAEFWELVEDLENLFVKDSTKEGAEGGGGGGDGGTTSSTAGAGAFEGGSSSIRETSSKDVASTDILLVLTGDFMTPEPLSARDPFTVVAGVMENWLFRWPEVEPAGGGDGGTSGTEATVERDILVKLRARGGGGEEDVSSWASAKPSSSPLSTV